MATYNFVDSAAKGYIFLWDERAVILRMSIIPFVVKVLSAVGITALGLTDSYLRQGWLLIPSYFVEGWLVACLIRMALYNEPWPTRLEGKNPDKETAYLAHRSRTVMAGIAVYVLIKLVFSFLAGTVMDAANTVEAIEYTPPPNPTTQTFFIGMIVLAAMVWSFRLLWLYIPVVMDIPLRLFFQQIKGFITSVYMIGTWLLAMMPIALMFMMVVEMLYYIIPSEPDAPSVAYQFVFIIVQSVAEIVIAVATSIGMAYGIRAMIEGEEDDEDFV